LIDDVAVPIAVIIDVDLIKHIIAELIEVRSAGRSLQRDVIGDQSDRVRIVWANKRVDIGVVCYRVLGNLGGFTMG
jgi:hypothetical protein